MSAVPGRAAVIPIASRRPAQRVTSRRGVKFAALSGVCLLGLLGSVADSALAHSELLMLGAGDTPDGDDLGGVALALAGAIVGNIAACIGVALLLYWYLSRPTAEIVELRTRRLTER